jgi:hypothetical protein
MKNCSSFNAGKFCFSTENPQPFENFCKAKNRKDGLTAYCKNCLKHFRDQNKESRNETIQAWRRRNPDKMKEYRKNKAEINTERMRKWRAKNRLKSLYNISNEDWTVLFEKQNGKCAICGKHAKDLKRGLAVDHCHKTGKVRGLLCHPCNQGLGLFKEDLELMDRAIIFLTHHKRNSDGIFEPHSS